MDFLPVDTINISDIHQNMYWNYGRKIIATAKYIADYNNLHLIYLTNFKFYFKLIYCGITLKINQCKYFWVKNILYV